MKFAISVIVFFCLIQATTEFALRNDFEDDDILELVEHERKVREVAVTDVTLTTEDIIEASGEEPILPKKSVVKRDKPIETEIEASGQENSSGSSEETESSRHPKRSVVEELEGSGEATSAVAATATTDSTDDAGRQRRVAGEEIIEASGEEATTTTITTA